MKNCIELRGIDKKVLFVIGILITLNGLYTAGPWYLDSSDGSLSPLFLTLFEDRKYVTGFGVLVLVSGVWLTILSVRKGFRNRRILTNVLFAAILLRLYSLIGVLLTLDSWRPPGYLSQTATVVIMAVYWGHLVQKNDRQHKLPAK